MAKLKRFIQFLKVDIWRIQARDLSKIKSFWLRQLRIGILTIRGFDEDLCLLRASALTYYSLLSVVPVLALVFAIAKGFGFEVMLERQLYEKLPAQQEAIGKILELARSILENVKGGVIAGIGVIVLFCVIFKMLSDIEDSFNDIWGIKKARSIGRKFGDYFSATLICPILLIVSSSVTVLIMSRIQIIVQKVELLGAFSPLIMTLIKLIPYCFIWILFTFVYVFMPNTKVNFKSGIVGGVVAGTIYQIAQWIYIIFQVALSRLGAVYGSFAALPLFLLWLQISWLIVLFGAEVSFANQNVETYEFEPESLKVSHAFKRLLALRVTHVCVKNFHEARKPQTAEDISHYLEVPVRLIHQVLFELSESEILSELMLDDAKTVVYQPAHDIDNFTIKNVMDMLDQKGVDDIQIAQSPELDKLSQSLETFSKIIHNSSANLNLKNI